MNKKQVVTGGILLVFLVIAGFILWDNLLFTGNIEAPTPMFYGFNSTFGCCGGGCVILYSENGFLDANIMYQGWENEATLEDIRISNKDSGECKIDYLQYNSTKFDSTPIHLTDIYLKNNRNNKYFTCFVINAVDCAPENARHGEPFELNVSIRYSENVSGQMVEKTSEGTIRFVYI